MPRKIAFFGLMYGSSSGAFDDWDSYLGRLAAAVVDRSRGTVSVDLVATGPTESEEVVAPGVVLRVLPACGRTRISTDATSWKLADYLDVVDLVHIHATVTGLCEAASLLCGLRGLPLCMTHNALAFDSLFADLGLVHLADMVVCHSAGVANRLGGGPRVVVLPAKLSEAPADDLAFGLSQVYSRLFALRTPTE